jgi:hypothetical protein
MNSAEHIRVGGNGFENYWTFVAFTVGENDVHTVDAERVAFLPFDARASAAFGGRLVFFPFAFLERFEVIENVVADFLELFSDLGAGIFFF